MAKDSTATLDKELTDGIQQARKKKPRYFALVAKGAEVVGLVVQKKAITESLAQKTKSECKGTLVIKGVCQGEGGELLFEVVDQEPSIQPKKIKDFIAARTEITVKPQWSVVDKLSEVAADDEGKSPEGEDQKTTVQQGNEAGGEEDKAPSPVDAKSLQARLKSLLVRQKPVVEKNPALREELLKLAQSASALAAKGSADAVAVLDKLEEAISAAEKAGPQKTTESSTKTEKSDGDPAGEFKARFTKLHPEVKERLTAGGPATEKLKAAFTQAGAAAKSQKWPEANKLLDELEALLAADSQASSEDQAPSPEQLAFETRLAAIEPQYLQALSDRPDDASRLRGILGFAQGKAEKKDYGAAMFALEKLMQEVRGKADEESDEEAEGNEETDSPTGSEYAAIAAKIKKQNPALQKALDLATESEKLSADVESAMETLADSLGGEDDESDGESDGASERAAVAAALKKQSPALQKALDLATEASKAAAAVEKAADTLASSLGEEDDDSDEARSEEGEAANVDELTDRLKDVEIQAAALPEPAKSELQGRARKALQGAAGSDLTALAAEVNTLEDDLAREASAARVSGAAGETGDQVSYRRLQIQWRDAQAESRKQLDQFVKRFLADKTVQADPRFKDIQAAANKVADQIPEFGTEIEDALSAIDDAADDDARASARAEAQKVIARCVATLDGSEGLQELQALADEGFGGGLFYHELANALTSLESQLASAT